MGLEEIVKVSRSYIFFKLTDEPVPVSSTRINQLKLSDCDFDKINELFPSGLFQLYRDCFLVILFMIFKTALLRCLFVSYPYFELDAFHPRLKCFRPTPKLNGLCIKC